jgi:hypothetical protein
VRVVLARALIVFTGERSTSPVKYVFLFCGTQEQQRAWESLPAEQREQG